MAKLSRTQKFLEKHPMCCFCGGERKATTIEHAPPKVLFLNKQRWKGLEFPACNRCNNGSSQQDQVVALFSMLQGSAHSVYSPDKVEYTKKLAKGVKNNHKKDWPFFESTTKSGYARRDGGTIDAIKFNEKAIDEYLEPWATKTGLALWYEHSGKISSCKGLIAIHWITNAELNEHNEIVDYAKSLLGEGSLKQGDQDSNEQFYYKHGINLQEQLGVFIVVLQNCFTAVILTFEDEKLIEDPEIRSTLIYKHKKGFRFYKTSKLNGIEKVNI